MSGLGQFQLEAMASVMEELERVDRRLAEADLFAEVTVRLSHLDDGDQGDRIGTISGDSNNEYRFGAVA